MIVVGDSLQVLKQMPDESVHCCVTSPPYWGLRDYGIDGQIGLEKSPHDFILKMVELFREVHRVLRNDGTLWLNLGDSYHNGSPPGGQGKTIERAGRSSPVIPKTRGREFGLKPKNLVGIPWRVAFALQQDGWILRQDIIWHKTNPMPESVRDRCTKAHEYIFLLTKSTSYHFDQSAICEPCSPNTHARMKQSLEKQAGSTRANGGTRNDRPMKAVGGKLTPSGAGVKSNVSFASATAGRVSHRNKRSVWTVGTEPFKGAHFATFPSKLIIPCIRAGCPVGGVVLDPFCGSGTSGMVAAAHNRKFIGIELNPEYAKIARQRSGFPIVDVNQLKAPAESETKE